MPRFLVCSNSESPIPGSKAISRYCHKYGEYDNLETAMTRLKEVASNAYLFKNETIKYFVNEINPPDVLPRVVKSYYLE
jgi:hypothetical protein